MLRVVLDTNVLLVSISGNSKYHWLFQSILSGKFTLCLSNEILTEYAEIIGKLISRDAADNALVLFDHLPNIHFSDPHFRFRLLNDPDDNKFVDCAIASNAHAIVTHDRDFDILKTLDFPELTVLNLHEFELLLRSPN